MIKQFAYNLNYKPIKLPCSKCGKIEDRCWNLPYMCFECEGRNYPVFFLKIKMDIKKRDKFKCVCCDKAAKLCVHHIDKNVRNNNPQNLITLCTGCHSCFHSKECYKILKQHGIKKVIKYIKKKRKNTKKVFKTQEIEV